jgi:hemerythrin-like domain-containing protein
MVEREGVFGSLDPALLEDPLGFLSAEHTRQRAVLGHLDRLARSLAGPSRTAMARALAAWLAADLPLHLRDEEDSVYPRLPPDAAGLTGSLAGENRASEPQRALLHGELVDIARGHEPSGRFAEAALHFVAQYRRHLAIEELNLMPAARRALGVVACRAIAREMAARRGHGEPHA